MKIPRITRSIVLVGTLLAVGLLAGCTPPDPDPPTAADLFGTWSVTSPTGDEGTMLLDDEGLTYWKDECTGEGRWATADGAFVSRSDYAQSGCWQVEANGPTWLGAATEVSETEDGWTLRDSGGVVTAILAPAESPGEAPSRFPVSPFDEPLPSTTELSSPPVALPASLVAEGVAGVWVVDVEWEITLILAGTTWVLRSPYDSSASYCEPREGMWIMLDGGRVLTSPATWADVSCGGAIAEFIADTRLAGLDGEELVLLDRDGNELRRLLPAG